MSELPDCAGNKPDAARPTILIVDDQPENLEILSGVLKPHFQVRAARSGAQALRAAGTEPRPDLILLDIMMPEMDGFTVLARLRGSPATCHIPVIFVTALNAQKDEQHGFDMARSITSPSRSVLRSW